METVFGLFYTPKEYDLESFDFKLDDQDSVPNDVCRPRSVASQSFGTESLHKL